MNSKKENDILVKIFKDQLKSKIKLSSKAIDIKDDSNKILSILDTHNQTDIKYKNTYIIQQFSKPKNPGLDFKYFHKILQNYGLKESTNPKDNHLFGIISEQYYNTNFLLLNNFYDIESFRNKYYLYFNLKFHFPLHYKEHYPNSFLLDINTKLSKLENKLYIARPISGGLGNDIIIVNNQQTLENAKNLLIKQYYLHGISLTEYVTNPLLYIGRKMHLRAYMLFTIINNTFKSYLWEYARIFTAKNVYKNEDWTNKDIHDTHYDSSIKKHLIFPDDLYGHTTPNIKNASDCDIIYKNSCECVEKISRIGVSNIYNYSNTKNSWEIYGIDILVKDDLNVFIMEINKYTNYYDFPDELLKKYTNWIDDCVIKPALFPNLEVPKTKSTTPVFEITIMNY
jgi:hypothetical protein